MKTSKRDSSPLKREQQFKLIKIDVLLFVKLIISHCSKNSYKLYLKQNYLRISIMTFKFIASNKQFGKIKINQGHAIN